MAITAALAIPTGVMAAIYLEEYAKKNWLTNLIEINIANLAGVPSVIYGLLGLGVFVNFLALERSIISGGATLALLALPIIIMSTREALRAVPPSIREAGLALGASRWQTVSNARPPCGGARHTNGRNTLALEGHRRNGPANSRRRSYLYTVSPGEPDYRGVSVY